MLLARRVESGEIEALVRGLAEDHGLLALSAEDRVMLDYATKLTVTPSRIEEADVQGLRDRGFEDRAIHDICSIASYFAFVNRIADGLGVELEATEDR